MSKLGTQNRSRRATADSVARIIASIYDTALTPKLWTVVPGQPRDMFGLSFAASVIGNPERTEIDGVAVGVDQDDYQGFLASYFLGSPFLAHEKEWYAGQAIRSREVVPHRVFHRTEMYQAYWRPRDMYEGLRLMISLDDTGVHHFVNLVRPPASDGFEQSDIELAHVLMPHLQRAAISGQRLHHTDALASAALATLDMLPHAVLLLDRDARLIHANTDGRALLARADGLAATQGVLRATTPALTNQCGAHRASGGRRRHAVPGQRGVAAGQPAPGERSDLTSPGRRSAPASNDAAKSIGETT